MHDEYRNGRPWYLWSPGKIEEIFGPSSFYVKLTDVFLIKWNVNHEMLFQILTVQIVMRNRTVHMNLVTNLTHSLIFVTVLISSILLDQHQVLDLCHFNVRDVVDSNWLYKLDCTYVCWPFMESISLISFEFFVSQLIVISYAWWITSSNIIIYFSWIHIVVNEMYVTYFTYKLLKFLLYTHCLIVWLLKTKF